jgi:hypothetical protein
LPRPRVSSALAVWLTLAAGELNLMVWLPWLEISHSNGTIMLGHG